MCEHFYENSMIYNIINRCASCLLLLVTGIIGMGDLIINSDADLFDKKMKTDT